MHITTEVALQGVCDALVKVAAQVRQDTNAVVATNDHIPIIQHYDQLRKATASIKEARKALEELEEQMSRDIIPDVMRLAGIKTINLEGVGRVTVSYRYSCSMLDKERGLLWLKEHGHGDIIQETVPSATMSGFAKNLLEVEGKELPEDLFKVGTSPFTSITKAK